VEYLEKFICKNTQLHIVVYQLPRLGKKGKKRLKPNLILLEISTRKEKLPKLDYKLSPNKQEKNKKNPISCIPKCAQKLINSYLREKVNDNLTVEWKQLN